MWQILLQNTTAILLQNATKVYDKIRQVFYYKMRHFYYKMRQLLQIATIFYKMGRLLQIATIQYVITYHIAIMIVMLNVSAISEMINPHNVMMVKIFS